MADNMPFVTVGSITYAIKGRDILMNNGIKAYIERTPKGYNDTGCGYSIYFKADEQVATDMLQKAGVKLKGKGGAL